LYCNKTSFLFRDSFFDELTSDVADINWFFVSYEYDYWSHSIYL